MGEPSIPSDANAEQADQDVAQLRRMGYQQELLRRMSGFSNFAISMSIICILAGGVTSFSQGFCSVGGASIGLGWPLVCLFSLTVAATMGQVASAFPTAGGLYHWAAILGGRGWGWTTAWFNLAGLITVMTAINVGFVRFVNGSLGAPLPDIWVPLAVTLVTAAQATLNHRGIRTTTRLTDFSGWWILGVALVLTVSLALQIEHWQWSRLVTFQNFSGPAGLDTWPRTENVTWLFLLGFLLPAYTLTGFDASAHVAEETVGAAANVPRAIVRSVLVSGICGWILLSVTVLAMPSLEAAAGKGEHAFTWTMRSVLPPTYASIIIAGIAVAQFLCGLATVTSASRMAFAFARDGGLPGSRWLKFVSPTHRTPVWSIWLVAALSSLAAFLPYATVAAVCAVFLYISYVLPAMLGCVAWGRTWTVMGPWHLGIWYRPLALLAVVGCGGLLLIGVQPPNQQAVWIVGGSCLLLLVGWLSHARKNFAGPPVRLLDAERTGQSV